MNQEQEETIPAVQPVSPKEPSVSTTPSPIAEIPVKDTDQHSSVETVTPPIPTLSEEEKTMPPPTVQPVSSPAGRVSGLSLKSLQKKRELKEKIASQQPDITNLPSDAFTEDEMLIAWKSYVQKLIDKGEKIMASVLEADQPSLKGIEIHLEFPNETMKVEVERAQGPLLEHLKKALNNYDIILAIAVNEEAQKKYAYTPQEKYEQLKGQNPNLELLRKTFDLEL